MTLQLWWFTAVSQASPQNHQPCPCCLTRSNFPSSPNPQFLLPLPVVGTTRALPGHSWFSTSRRTIHQLVLSSMCSWGTLPSPLLGGGNNIIPGSHKSGLKRITGVASTESSEAASCTAPIRHRPGVDCRLQSLPAARRRGIVSLAGEAGLQQVSWINRLTVFVREATCNRSVFVLPADIKTWLMDTPTYKEAGTSGIESVWIWTGVIWQRNQENNCA